jgi:hypothetical protein
MKILKNGIKIRQLKIDLETQLIEIIYEKGISVEYITLTLEQAKDINFINFENLKL